MSDADGIGLATSWESMCLNSIRCRYCCRMARQNRSTSHSVPARLKLAIRSRWKTSAPRTAAGADSWTMAPNSTRRRWTNRCKSPRNLMNRTNRWTFQRTIRSTNRCSSRRCWTDRKRSPSSMARRSRYCRAAPCWTRAHRPMSHRSTNRRKILRNRMNLNRSNLVADDPLAEPLLE